MSEIFIVAYGKSGYRDGVVFVAIIVILVILPQGIFGKSVEGTK